MIALSLRPFEPFHEKREPSAVRFENLQMRMSSHSKGQGCSSLSEALSNPPYCVSGQTAIALARLRGSTGSPDPSLFAYVIRTFSYVLAHF